MGLKDRIRRLEGPHRTRSCPQCGDQIIEKEHHEDGTVTYPFGEPCEACGNKPPGGGIGIIEVCPPEKGAAGDVSWP